MCKVLIYNLSNEHRHFARNNLTITIKNLGLHELKDYEPLELIVELIVELIGLIDIDCLVTFEIIEFI